MGLTSSKPDEHNSASLPTIFHDVDPANPDNSTNITTSIQKLPSSREVRIESTLTVRFGYEDEDVGEMRLTEERQQAIVDEAWRRLKDAMDRISGLRW
jgi:hypothetical protein